LEGALRLRCDRDADRRLDSAAAAHHSRHRHLEFLVIGDTITAIAADFSPSGLEEVLAQLGLELP